MKIKICTSCKQEKSLDEFYKTNKSKDGLTWYCKECIKIKNIQYREKYPNYDKDRSKEWYYSHLNERKKYNRDNKERENSRRREDRKSNFNKHKDKRLKYSYGISFNEYTNLLNEQNGVCAICGKEELRINPKSNKPYLLSVDHNHQTGKVRGLLCCKCNPGIGNFQEDVDLLQGAIKYIQKYK